MRRATIKDQLSTHQRSTVSLRGEGDILHQVRLSSTPEPVHQETYRILDRSDPLARRQRRRKPQR